MDKKEIICWKCAYVNVIKIQIGMRKTELHDQISSCSCCNAILGGFLLDDLLEGYCFILQEEEK